MLVHVFFGMDQETHDAIPPQPWPVGGEGVDHHRRERHRIASTPEE